jgi:hypothetical protein
MSDERPVDLNFLAEQQQGIIADQRLMLDELHVQGAIVRRLDNSQARVDETMHLLLDELRAIHRLLAHVVDRVRAIEERGE